MKATLVITFLLCVGLLMPGVVLAEGTSCGFETIAIPDGSITTQQWFPGTTTYWWYMGTQVGDSYCIQWKATDAACCDSIGTVAAYTSCAIGFLGSRDTSDITPGDSYNMARRCWIATSTSHRFSLNRTSASGIYYEFSVADTTLYSPAWSTNGSYNTYYSFFNTTNTSCSATLTLYNTAGTVVDTSSLSIASKATAATNTAAMATTRNSTGTAKLAHNCPAGAILAEADIANLSVSPAYIQPVKFSAVRQEH